MQKILESTAKYDLVRIIENTDADELKKQIRLAIEQIDTPEELFFYFTGHGYHDGNEFYFCAKNFNLKRPNETGISNSELHTLLRLANANLVTKVVDACNSGVQLVKSDNSFMPQNKDGFKNLIQISSCLDTQNSLTGDPLSLFTEKFIAATLRKTEGKIYYTDIISTLRDEFIGNDYQTPYFVFQHTGREVFVEDASLLDGLRKKPEAFSLMPTIQLEGVAIVPAPTLLDRLRDADQKLATAGVITNFVDRFYDGLLTTISTSDFSDFFEHRVVEHASYVDTSTKKFMIRALSKEKRADNFVTATYSRELNRTSNRSGLAATLATMGSLYSNDALYHEEWELDLNCTMKRAQICITLIPKFSALQQIKVVISFAPSLDQSYIFETITQHKLYDFDRFEPIGTEISQRWWRRKWDEPSDGIVSKISEKLLEAVSAQLEAAEDQLKLT